MSLVPVVLALRAGLRMRQRRARGLKTDKRLIGRHVALARPAVLLVLVGFLGGPLSALLLRDWQPFATLHAWLGLIAALLFGAAGRLGWRLSKSRSAAVEAHGWLGLLATLAAALTAFAGFVLLP